MEDAFSNPQAVLLVGGTSEIGLAILHELVSPNLQRVVVASRSPERARDAVRAMAPSSDVQGIDFDAVTFDSGEFASECLHAVGEVDVVILALGVLGDQSMDERSPKAAAEVQRVNATVPIEIAHRFVLHLENQGHGALVVLSSIAAVRVRRDNFVYGASKASLDAFAQGLALMVEDSGARVLIVRPGFVATKMTEGMEPAPFATTASAVAGDVRRALERRKNGVIYSPPMLRGVALGLANAPSAVIRRMKG